MIVTLGTNGWTVVRSTGNPQKRIRRGTSSRSTTDPDLTLFPTTIVKHPGFHTGKPL